MLDHRIIAELTQIAGEESVSISVEDLICHSFDGTFAEHWPDVVIVPRTTEQVSRIMQVAFREGIPVVPQGMSSGLAAGSVPFSEGIALSLTRMNQILEIDR